MYNIVMLYASFSEGYMRTTLDLPGNLLIEAMKLSHANTKIGVIVRALDELLRKSKSSNLKKE
ncbi:hypothetical protein BJAS_P2640 [Bathymodiolus japonicus methanotrophic gill symbiont]|uniref:type II toxin-antitoxin system VapB family antitoxin n=1 Tax=Bathymodiolus japonicus methanotrophic gill symbiont TaxID=113269 RepID=UPI001B7B286B|nr:hypothetical protein BJAS_P2640 [Bathymodiolus japonicus methanotrophic gill symbiont]